jgi:hypothetical protein
MREWRLEGPFQTASNYPRKPDDPESRKLVNGNDLEPGPPRPSLLVKRPKTGKLPTCSVNLMRVLRDVQRQLKQLRGGSERLKAAQGSTATAQGYLFMGSS